MGAQSWASVGLATAPCSTPFSVSEQMGVPLCLALHKHIKPDTPCPKMLTVKGWGEAGGHWMSQWWHLLHCPAHQPPAPPWKALGVSVGKQRPSGDPCSHPSHHKQPLASLLIAAPTASLPPAEHLCTMPPLPIHTRALALPTKLDPRGSGTKEICEAVD